MEAVVVGGEISVEVRQYFRQADLIRDEQPVRQRPLKFERSCVLGQSGGIGN